MLDTEIAGIELKNPVMVASGTFGNEFAGLVDLREIGAVITKSVTYEPKTGNPPPRTCETAAGMLNSIGLENRGVKAFMEGDLKALTEAGATVIVSVAGETTEEFSQAVMVLNEAEGVAGIELNVSCPNVERGGIYFGCRPRLAAEVTAAVKAISRYPVIVKLTPNVTSVTEVAKAVEAAGADAISLINTVIGMSIDVETQRPKLGHVTGGLSGPAIKPIALRMVYETAAAVALPIIGVGGIMNTVDAVEFLLAGASAIQVGTANFINPRVAGEIAAGLENYLESNLYDHVSQLIGKARQ